MDSESRICAGRPENAADSKKVALYFATNRLPADGDQGSLSFGFGRADELSYGRLVVLVPPDATRSFGSVTQDFRIAEGRRYPSEAEFARALRASTLDTSDGTGRKPSLIFVHGYAESFERAAYRNAQIVADGCLDVVPVMFSWPSHDSPLDYLYDRESATFSRDALLRVIRVVRDENEPGKTHLFAHSMGNWIAMESASALPRDGPRSFGAMVLASPDIDVDVFRKDLPGVERSARKVVLLTSSHDVLLGISQFAASGVPRAGNVADRDLAEHRIRETKNFSVVRMENSSGGDCSPFDHHCAETSRRMLNFIREFLSRDLMPTGLSASWTNRVAKAVAMAR